MDKLNQMQAKQKEESIKKAYKEVLKQMIDFRVDHKIVVEPPVDLKEFEDRLESTVTRLYRFLFGVIYYLDFDERSTLRKDTSLENVIDILITCNKKNSEGIKLDHKMSFSWNQRHDCYVFLKRVLERNCPLHEDFQEYIGIYIDHSGISLPEKREIAMQAAAQVLWFFNKGQISLVSQMRVEIWKNKSLASLLELKRVQNARVVEDWIRKINPMPKAMRKGAPSKRQINNDWLYSNIILIPEVFSENPNRTNFLKLRFTVMVIAKIMSTIGMQQEEILGCKIIQSYEEPLKFYPKNYIREWVVEALLKNGSIYDL